MPTIIKINTDGEGKQFCELPFTKDQWLDVLHDKMIVGPVWMRLLLSYYFMPGHKATCTQCAEKYGYHFNTYNSGISAFSKAVLKKFDYPFDIVDENGNRIYWPVAMGIGRRVTAGKGVFEWQLRKELVNAIEEMLIENAINRYTSEMDKYWDYEKYKWQAVQWFQEHWDIDNANLASMIESATGKTANLLASMNSFPRGMIINLAKVAPNDVREMFINLYDESKDLIGRVQDFMNKAEEIREKFNPGDWSMHYQSTNAVSVYLWLRYPDKYYIYKYSEYREVARKLGLDYVFKKNGQPAEMAKGFKMYDMLNGYLRQNGINVDIIRSHLDNHPELYQDPQFRTATIDLGFWISRWFDSAEKTLYLNNTSDQMDSFIEKACNLLKIKKNLILQGAPGTGKTYNTAALSLALIDGIVPETHEEVMTRYEQLRSDGRIGFTTFHQSMDYEDFIEGIKPVHEAGSVRYEIEDGIFKQLCSSAKVASEVAATGTDNLLEGMNSNPTIWKVSLEGTGDNPTRRDCMANGYIRIGWAEYGDTDFTEDNPKVTEGKYILRAFQNDMQIGDIVVSCWSQDETDAIGIVTGDYEYHENGGNFPRFRSVRWIVKGIKHNIKEINNGKHMTLGTIYRLPIALEDLLNVVKQYSPVSPTLKEPEERPYVLIIDEINRANVSKVFGELITLIEKDKRLGAEHPVTLALPYSKQKDFGVPKNIYIIGTMNTTDRSTGTLDYAIRRRFAFLTIPAKREIIKDETAGQLFDDVRKFIETHKYADMDIEDLMVGHSYFMADNYSELSMKIQFEVIPLIKEYIKDGILSVKRDESNRYFKSWSQLQPLDDSNSGTSED